MRFAYWREFSVEKDRAVENVSNRDARACSRGRAEARCRCARIFRFHPVGVRCLALDTQSNSTPFGVAELNLAGTHPMSFRPSERRGTFSGSRSINVSLLRSEEPRKQIVHYSNILQRLRGSVRSGMYSQGNLWQNTSVEYNHGLTPLVLFDCAWAIIL